MNKNKKPDYTTGGLKLEQITFDDENLNSVQLSSSDVMEGFKPPYMMEEEIQQFDPLSLQDGSASDDPLHDPFCFSDTIGDLEFGDNGLVMPSQQFDPLNSLDSLNFSDKNLQDGLDFSSSLNKNQREK